MTRHVFSISLNYWGHDWGAILRLRLRKLCVCRHGKGVVICRFSRWVNKSDLCLEFLFFILGPSSVWMIVWTRPAISGVAVGLVFRAVNYPDCRVRVFFTRREAPPPAALLRFRNLKKKQHVLSGRIRESNGAFLEEVSFMLLVYFYFWDMVSRRNRSLEKNVRVGASLRALRLAPLRK